MNLFRQQLINGNGLKPHFFHVRIKREQFRLCWQLKLFLKITFYLFKKGHKKRLVKFNWARIINPKTLTFPETPVKIINTSSSPQIQFLLEKIPHLKKKGFPGGWFPLKVHYWDFKGNVFYFL
ncbi:MAG: hypothetical protein CM15mP121_2910 [Bacteroidota bacterium]|nr:MAG: hypothetical protein CM15mP121_2910 [Bacteroidota bacterium]